jgi:plastocyanin
MITKVLFVILGLIVAVFVGIHTIFVSPVQSQSSTETATLVHAGEGNITSVTNAFIPSTVQIKVGESVTWDNPTEVAQPHSVTFLNDKAYFAEFEAAFQVPNSTKFKSSIQNSNSEVIVPPNMPGAPESEKTVMAINGRAYLPVAIDSTGKNVTYLPPNSNYTMEGTEKYFNTGWLWPEGMTPGGGPQLSNFTVTFEKQGTYNYLCNVHPWMTGSVQVQ